MEQNIFAVAGTAYTIYNDSIYNPSSYAFDKDAFQFHFVNIINFFKEHTSACSSIGFC
jgi:hypothetical protein